MGCKVPPSTFFSPDETKKRTQKLKTESREAKEQTKTYIEARQQMQENQETIGEENERERERERES
jgi:hypothetical protein